MNILIWNYLVLGFIWGVASVVLLYNHYKDAPNELYAELFKPFTRDYVLTFIINALFWPVTFVTAMFMKDR